MTRGVECLHAGHFMFATESHLLSPRCDGHPTDSCATGAAKSRLGSLVWSILILGWFATSTGCTMLPERMDKPQLYNPFPQLHKVAIVPFFNQSDVPTVNGAEVANAYRHQLQQIRGFEVLPIGVVDQFLRQNPIAVNAAPDFQLLAQQLGVDAVVVGSITDFDQYYPPRMGLAVRWYAANTCLHPIPPGYGLPWGTPEEEYIPEELRYEAEFALATEQLKTQTPLPSQAHPNFEDSAGGVRHASYQQVDPAMAARSASSQNGVPNMMPLPGQQIPGQQNFQPVMAGGPMVGIPGSSLPPDWPDPNGFVPDPPTAQRPTCIPQREAVMELIKQYDGSDADFTARLQSYYEFRDDERFGGWKSYLDRKEDFINFCCYLHISELLAGRGGAGESRVVWRWPFSRYQP